MLSHYEDFEIIAVNDGSNDNTIAQLRIVQKEITIKVIDSAENEGKGCAVKKGVFSAEGEGGLVMFLDADLAIPVQELENFSLEIDKGKDIVIASRFVPGLRVLEPVLWYRKIMEKFFCLLRMIVLRNWNIKDTQCGFKVFKREVAFEIFKMATIKRFAFDAELLFIANNLGYSIKEMPITLNNPKKSNVRLLYDPINMLFALLKIRMNAINGVYRR
jgi:glycosyltransferase involved in cell wall biosynthesis